MKIRILMLGSILLLLGLVACGNAEDQSASSLASEESNKLTIYTTLFPLQDFAERIGGEHVEVESILPAGANPHTFEPTTKMMVELAEADAFIYNGANLEAYATKISEAIGGEGVEILEASEGVELLTHVHDHSDEGEEESHEDHAHEEGEEPHEDHAHEEGEESHEDHAHEEGKESHEDHAHEEGEESHEDHAHEEEANESGSHNDQSEEHVGHNHGDQDPHVWLDPVRAITLAENIKDQLVELNPEAKEDFEKNFDQLKQDLMELDQTFHSKLEAAESNKILVSHAAYGYWEKAYGLEQIAISGLSPTNEPSQKQLESIIKKSQKNNIDNILFEQNVTPKVASVIQKEIDADIKRIHNLSVLTEDDLNAGEDYFSLMNHNLEVLLEVLNK
ncbi:zinc ABC transporter substrate-binding protein [Pontibacillus sp. ALD_SL1]|uniref:metal ABC transporter solute-binding protein, Zn/Mn family n=1 Tax=Pontibacillus sp. ALD_SL1 TaxID=2777185 RepID=UPI001A965B5C|nr:zinc ABC transporter substrate-binding protein [Pontibacillus sp. ALD_SL1]QST01330.1 zinc ABC transporter substrate-binding protein [Pontibacillus sp. ALD_SL1]